MVIVHLSFGNGSLMSNQSVIYVLVQIILIFLAFCHILVQIILIFLTLVKQNSVTCFFLKMISFLGVSKAVLDNVIFCHQEESNWSVTSVNNVILLLCCFVLHSTTMHCIVLYIALHINYCTAHCSPSPLFPSLPPLKLSLSLK